MKGSPQVTRLVIIVPLQGHLFVGSWSEKALSNLDPRAGRDLRVVQHFELVFPDLDVDRPGLLLDKNAVDAEIL